MEREGKRHFPLAVFAVLLAGLWGARTDAAVKITPVVYTGMDAPTPVSGEVFRSQFSGIGLCDDGSLAFSADVGPSGPLSPSNAWSYWFYDQTNFNLVARYSDQAPDLASGINFMMSGAPNLGPGGVMAFGGYLEGAGISSGNDKIFYRYDPLNEALVIAQEGDLAPNSAGKAFREFFEPDLYDYPYVIDGGDIYFMARVIDNTPGIYVSGDGSGVEKIVRYDDPVGPTIPEPNSFEFFYSPRAISSQLYYAAKFRMTTNVGLSSANNSAIYEETPSSRDRIFWESDIADGLPGNPVWYSHPVDPVFDGLTLNGGNLFAFRASVTGTINGVVNPHGLWVGPPTATRELIMLEGAPVPGITNAVFQFPRTRPVITGDGTVYFKVTLSGTGIGDTNDMTIWRYTYEDTNSLELLLREGELAPGILPELSANIDRIFTFAANGQGDLAVYGAYTPPETYFSHTLWMLPRSGTWVRAFTESAMPIRPGLASAVTELSMPGQYIPSLDTGVPFSPERTDGQPTLFLDNGKLLFQARFLNYDTQLFTNVRGIYLLEADNERLVPKTAYNFPESGMASERINAYTGELLLQETPDLFFTGKHDTKFQRFYASAIDRETGTFGRMGNNWRHNYDWRFQSVDTNEVQIFTPRGKAIYFERTGSGTNDWKLLQPHDIPYTMQRRETFSGSEYWLVDPLEHKVYVFNYLGQVIRVHREDFYNNMLSYSGYKNTDRLQLDQVTGTGTYYLHYTNGLLARVTDGTRTVGFGYDEQYNLAFVTNVLGDVIQYQYDLEHEVPGLLTNVIQPEGNAPWSWGYDAAGRIAREKNASGGTFTFSAQQGTVPGTFTLPDGSARAYLHNTNGQLTRLTDELGNRMEFGYNTNGQRTMIRDRLGGTTTQRFHSASGKRSGKTFPDGTWYDQAFRAVTNLSGWLNGTVFYYPEYTRFPDGTMEHYYQEPWSGTLTCLVDRAGSVFTWIYDTSWSFTPTNAVNPLGGNLFFDFNIWGNGFFTRRSQDGTNWQEFLYDTYGQLEHLVTPEGFTNTFYYDLAGNLTNLVDPEGAEWSFTYDRNNRLVKSVDPVGGVASNVYDDQDRLVKMSDPEGSDVELGYDERGLLTWFRDQLDRTWEIAPDAAGRPGTVTSPNGRTTRRFFDDEGRVSSVRDGDTNLHVYVSDRLGRLLEVRPPGGKVLALDRDEMGRIRSSTGPDGLRTDYHLDERGMVTNLLSASGARSTRLQRDAMGLVTNLVDADGNSWRYRYSPIGNVDQVVDPSGNGIALTYNLGDRVYKVKVLGGTNETTITYNKIGLTTNVTHSDGTQLDYQYSKRRELTNGTRIVLGYRPGGKIENSNGIINEYDEHHRLFRVTLRPGKTVTYTYDQEGNLATVTDWIGGVSSFDYDGAGRLVSWARPNGVTTLMQYDPGGRLTNIQHGALGSLSLKRGTSGRIIGMNRSLPVTPTFTPGAQTGTFNSASQRTDLQYDAQGRVTNDGLRAYQWDMAGRLTGFVQGGVTNRFQHDGLHTPVSQVVGGQTNEYIVNYAVGPKAVSIERHGPTDTYFYVWAPAGGLLYSIDASDEKRHFYHFDHKGSTVLLSSDAGAATDAYSYGPFGRVLGQSGSTPNPFTYLGGLGSRKDETSGLIHIGDRMYDPSRAGFISPSQFKRLGSQVHHPYTLSDNNPDRMARSIQGLKKWGPALGEARGGDLGTFFSARITELSGMLGVSELINKARLTHFEGLMDSYTKPSPVPRAVNPRRGFEAALKGSNKAANRLDLIKGSGNLLTLIGGTLTFALELRDNKNTTRAGAIVSSFTAALGTSATGSTPQGAIFYAGSSIVDNFTELAACYLGLDLVRPGAADTVNNAYRLPGVAIDTLYDSYQLGRLDTTSLRNQTKRQQKEQGGISDWLTEKGLSLGEKWGNTIFDTEADGFAVDPSTGKRIDP